MHDLPARIRSRTRGANPSLPRSSLVTFFPRHLIGDQKELDLFSEHDDDLPNSLNIKLHFERAKELGVDISVGHAERAADGKGPNTSVYYSAKVGLEDGKHDLIASSCVTDPEGHDIGQAKGKGDELIVAEIGLEDYRQGKKVFNFEQHRRVEQ